MFMKRQDFDYIIENLEVFNISMSKITKNRFNIPHIVFFFFFSVMIIKYINFGICNTK